MAALDWWYDDALDEHHRAAAGRGQPSGASRNGRGEQDSRGPAIVAPPLAVRAEGDGYVVCRKFRAATQQGGVVMIAEEID
jgi:hypothetical protein